MAEWAGECNGGVRICKKALCRAKLLTTATHCDCLAHATSVRCMFKSHGRIHVFRNFLITLLGFIAGAVVTYLVVVVGTLLVWDWQGVHDQDGGGAMALGLVIGPAVAIVGGIVSAIFALRFALRRAKSPVAGDNKRDIGRFLIVGGAVLGGLGGYNLAQFGFWLASPIQFDSYWKAWVVSWLPTLFTLFGIAVGGFVVSRMKAQK